MTTTEIAPLASIDDLRAGLSSASQALQQGAELYNVAAGHAPMAARYSSEQAYKLEFDAYLPRLEAAEQTALDLALRVRSQARQALDQLAGDYIQLTPLEEQRAANLRAMVKEDCDRPWQDVLHRIRQSALSGDRVDQVLTARYVRMRLQAGSADNLLPEELDARHAVASAIETLQTKLTSSTVAQLREKAIAVMEQASKLEQDASARKRATTRYSFTTPKDLAW